MMTGDEILRKFYEEEERHLKRMRRIRMQGYVMQGAIILLVAIFIFWPFFL